ncbi:MAG: PDZ domain-containing protein [Edaphobacter sp.]
MDSPGHRAGIRTGDILVSVDDQPTPRVASLGREMYRTGIWGHATYSILRPVPQSNGSERRSTAGYSGVPGGERPFDQPGPAIYCAGLPVDRNLRAVPALDRAQIHPFLRLLPGVVCAVQLPLDRRAGHL